MMEELLEELFEDEASEEGFFDEPASEEDEPLSFLEEDGLELPEELLLSEELSLFDEGVSFSEEVSEGVELVLSEEEPLSSKLPELSEFSKRDEPPIGTLGFFEGLSPPQLNPKAITAPISKIAKSAAAIMSHRLSVFLSASTACFSSKEVIQ
jgi:hypothetical protein